MTGASPRRHRGVETVQVEAMSGVPNGIRTRVTAVKGRCPGPLDDGDRVERKSDARRRASPRPRQTPLPRSAKGYMERDAEAIGRVSPHIFQIDVPSKSSAGVTRRSAGGRGVRRGKRQLGRGERFQSPAWGCPTM